MGVQLYQERTVGSRALTMSLNMHLNSINIDTDFTFHVFIFISSTVKCNDLIFVRGSLWWKMLFENWRDSTII